MTKRSCKDCQNCVVKKVVGLVRMIVLDGGIKTEYRRGKKPMADCKRGHWEGHMTGLGTLLNPRSAMVFETFAVGCASYVPTDPPQPVFFRHDHHGPCTELDPACLAYMGKPVTFALDRD